MKNIFKRLLLFTIGIPALVIITVAIPQFNHLGFSFVVITVSILGAMEVASMLKEKNMNIKPLEAAVLGGTGPVFTALVINFGLGPEFMASAFCIAASWVLVSRVFSPLARLDPFVNRTVAGFTVLIYPGLLMAWGIGLSAFPRAEAVIITYFLITLLNDAVAWLFGMLFGAGNRGIIPASPNKSIAGFIGGLSMSITVGVFAVHFFPDAFPAQRLPWFISGGILGLCSGIAAILGDLAESCFKRSSGVKDSGGLMPGRGGIMDSLDSLSLVAPLYYLLFRLLFT